MKSFIVSIFTLVFLATASTEPAVANQVVTAPIDSTGLTRKVDSFWYLVDYSGSMMMRHNKLKDVKMEIAKKILKDVNDLLPDLGYNAGLFTFAPYANPVPMGAWERARMQVGINNLNEELPIFGRTSDLGDAFIEHSPAVASIPGPRKALILVSDGQVNKGANPVIEARNLLVANPDLCLHIISLADSEQGMATLDAIGRLKRCNVTARAEDLLDDSDVMRQFVSDVFVEQGQVMEEVMVLRGVNFAFDSARLEPTAQAVLNEVAFSLRQRPQGTILLKGYTDAFGSDAYNRNLSQKRAESVRAYLAAQGLDPARMMAQGMGKSFTYDNATEEGCYMNRRVEVEILD